MILNLGPQDKEGPVKTHVYGGNSRECFENIEFHEHCIKDDKNFVSRSIYATLKTYRSELL